jgi:adenylate cyclase
MSVLFSDLAGFTTISEKMTPAELVHLLNQYLTEMTDIVLAEGGIIDKYEGDAIMAEFGAPLPLADHADRAVRAGLKMQRRLKELREIWKGQGLPELRCRVGINTGYTDCHYACYGDWHRLPANDYCHVAWRHSASDSRRPCNGTSGT